MDEEGATRSATSSLMDATAHRTPRTERMEVATTSQTDTGTPNTTSGTPKPRKATTAVGATTPMVVKIKRLENWLHTSKKDRNNSNARTGHGNSSSNNSSQRGKTGKARGKRATGSSRGVSNSSGGKQQLIEKYLGT